MAEKSTIARPYAKALFALALEQKQLGAWAQTLAVAAEVVGDERVKRLLTSPHVTPAQLADLVIEIAGAALEGGLDEPGGNFIRMLAANRRLGFLPEIAAIFEQAQGRLRRTPRMSA